MYLEDYNVIYNFKSTDATLNESSSKISSLEISDFCMNRNKEYSDSVISAHPSPLENLSDDLEFYHFRIEEDQSLLFPSFIYSKEEYMLSSPTTAFSLFPNLKMWYFD